MPKVLAASRLDARESALATEIAFGTLRAQLRYDYLAGQAGDRDIAALDAQVRCAVRMGAHQLLDTRIPDHAAISETVAAVRKITNRGAAGTVNALLRTLQRRRQHLREPQDLPTRYSHPKPLVRALDDALSVLGLSDTLPQLLEEDNRAPYVTLVARPGLTDRESLADEAEELLDADTAFTPYSPWGVTISRGEPGRLPQIRSAAAAVQDEGSQLVAGICAELPVHADGGERAWLDLCAGPGGKTAILAGLARERTTGNGESVKLHAIELHRHRAQLTRKTLKDFPEVSVECADGRAVKGLYQRVLVDAPCSGLGSLRRHPEARYRSFTAQLPQLVNLQRQLLNAAIAVTQPGGVICYSTCSPLPVETRDNVKSALSDGRLKLLDLSTIARQHFDLDVSGPTIQLWPHIHGTDAMYIAAFERLA